MSAVIAIANTFTATVIDGDWKIKPDFPIGVDILTEQNPINSPSIPNYDLACALAALDMFQKYHVTAKLISFTKVESNPNVIY